MLRAYCAEIERQGPVHAKTEDGNVFALATGVCLCTVCIHTAELRVSECRECFNNPV